MKKALARMKTIKARPDGIPVEVWKCLGQIERVWSIGLFNNMLGQRNYQMNGKGSVAVPMYKSRGDI